MLRFAVIVIVFASIVGAIMPSTPRAPAKVSSSDAFSVAPSGAPHGGGWPTRSASSANGGSITLFREDDGHFYADAQVNGMPVHFLVDTGASGIALAREDAERAGVLVDPSEGGVIGSGASGEVRGHYVELDRVTLGSKEAEDMTAVVLEGGDMSLFGQSFLSRFDSVEIHGDEMVLR
jgi:aspartyl protease family protein